MKEKNNNNKECNVIVSRVFSVTHCSNVSIVL